MWSTRGTQLAMGGRNICAAPCRFPLWFSIGNAQVAHGAQMNLPPVASTRVMGPRSAESGDSAAGVRYFVWSSCDLESPERHSHYHTLLSVLYRESLTEYTWSSA
jgi:hypothetical protein